MKIGLKYKFLSALILIAIGTAFYLDREILPEPKVLNNNSALNYKNITPLELDKLKQKSGIFLVDVHTPEQEHIAGTNLFVPFNKIKENLNKFPKDKNTQIVIYCRSGSMSLTASEELVKSGYKNVSNLVGGINAYRESHYGIFINPDTRDLGTVIYGNVAKTTFDLTNNTKEKITITKSTTSCGCTKAAVEKKELEPYEQTKINVSFDPAVHKDDTDLGDITREIYIETTHPNFSKIQSSITARVIKK